MSLSLRPVTFKEASAFILEHHRHHVPARGWKYGVGVADGDQLAGVIVVGRPVARGLDDGQTLEVTRCCVREGVKNAASMLYGAARRVARDLGYSRLITYTLESEPGTSLRAAGWTEVRNTRGGSWHCPSRPRTDKAPTCPKTLWEAA